jgi:hypothetical protein
MLQRQEVAQLGRQRGRDGGLPDGNQQHHHHDNEDAVPDDPRGHSHSGHRGRWLRGQHAQNALHLVHEMDRAAADNTSGGQFAAQDGVGLLAQELPYGPSLGIAEGLGRLAEQRGG